MAILDGTDVRLAIRVSSARIISANLPPGSVFPAHATAMGKVLLAGLDSAIVREQVMRHPLEPFTATTITCVDDLLRELRIVAGQGHASSNQEWEPGLRSIAAPALTRDGQVVAAACIVLVRPALRNGRMARGLLAALVKPARA